MIEIYCYCQRQTLNSEIHLDSSMAKVYHANTVLIPDKTGFNQNVTTQRGIFCNDKSLGRQL